MFVKCRILVVGAFLCGIISASAYAVIDANAGDGGPWTAYAGLDTWPNTTGTTDGDGTIIDGMQYYGPGDSWNTGDPSGYWYLNSPSAGLMETNTGVNGYNRRC